MKPLPKRPIGADGGSIRIPSLEDNGVSQSWGADASGTSVINSSGPTSMDSPRTAHKRVITLSSIGVLCISAMALLWLQSMSNKSVLRVDSARLATGEAQIRPFSEFVPLTGELIPARTSSIATVGGGLITAVHVEEGQAVEKGQALASLKNTDLELQLIQREAQLTEQLSSYARAQMAFDQTLLAHDRGLMETRLEVRLAQDRLDRRKGQAGTASQEEITQLEITLAHYQQVMEALTAARERDQQTGAGNLNQLEDSIGRMRESLELLRTNVDDLVVRAPITGRLSRWDAEVGVVAQRGLSLGQVDQVDGYKVLATVDEFYLSRLQVGQTAQAAGPNGVSLRLAKIFPTIEERRFQVEFEFAEAAPADLRRGQSLPLQLQLDHAREVLTIPNGAFFALSGGRWLYRLSEDGDSAIRQSVQLGQRSPDWVEVISGLTPGDRVLTSSYDGFEEIDTIIFDQNLSK